MLLYSLCCTGYTCYFMDNYYIRVYYTCRRNRLVTAGQSTNSIPGS